MTEFGLKELYEVTLKTTYPIEINGRTIEAGEVVAAFDKIQIANIQELKDFVAARGGFNNSPRVIWETTKEIKVNFSQGIFSKTQFALMSNARLLTPGSGTSVLISKREELESDEEGKIRLKEAPVGRVFVHNPTGEKVFSFEAKGKQYTVDAPFTNFIVDYTYDYFNGVTVMQVGQRLINGYLTLEGKTRVKDDITGHTKTGIIYIPKLKLMSDLSMQLGENAMPLVGRLDAIALPFGPRGNSRVMEFYFLNNDIDSDM